MMLSLENSESKDNYSLDGAFVYFTDEMADITWIQVFQIFCDKTGLTGEKINELVEMFIDELPASLKMQLQAIQEKKVEL